MGRLLCCRQLCCPVLRSVGQSASAHTSAQTMMQHSLLTRPDSHLQVTMLMCRADPSGSLIFQSGEGCQDLEPHVLGAHDRLCMPWSEIFCAGSWCWTAMCCLRAPWSPCPATWCTDTLTPTLSLRSSCLTAGCLTVSFASVETPCPCCTLSAKDSQNHASLQAQIKGGMHVGMEDGVLHTRICKVAVAP